MEFFDNKLCISVRELEADGILTQDYCRQLAARNRLKMARSGGGKGNYALVVVDSLPTEYQDQVNEKHPGGAAILLRGWIISNYELDQAAVAFFMDWAARQSSDKASDELARKYAVNASVLNTCIRLYNRSRDYRKLMGEKYDWSMMAATIETLREEFGHDLPASTLRFRKKVNEYKQYGYECLISGKFGNQIARKVDHKTERLICSIAVLPNKPFNSNVHEMYMSFVCGELDVYDLSTGEIYNPDDFTDKNGDPKELSESTIRNVLNKPSNKLLVEHALSSYTTFMHEQMPHVHRHNGEFSLSQITMDDVDLTRKLKDTKQRVHAYYAYDVVSQCVVGASYGRKKDQMLVVDCFRDMFRLIERNGWGIPAGIEVENHLMSEYKEGFLQAGVAFNFVHFCAPQNSQEKYAEPLNGAKKRSVIHKNHAGIGRFYGKGKWRTEYKKVSDEFNDTYEDREYFSFEQLVADDRRDSAEWNNTLHPNQKKYPGMTRWQVLMANINPTLHKYDKLTLSRFIGERVETSIRRNSTVRVAYEDWWLSDTSVLERLQPNDYKVTAYYLPDEEGKPTDVYIFQGDRYIDKVEKVETYNRVLAEQTEEDVVNYIEQQKKISSFGKYVRDNAIGQVGVAAKTEQPAEEEPVENLLVASETKPEVPDDIYEWQPAVNMAALGIGDM
jgi:hypothetical protein